jgi:hypothetical protein
VRVGELLAGVEGVGVADGWLVTVLAGAAGVDVTG